MSFNNLSKIQNELAGLGYSTRTFDSPRGKVVAFKYEVASGSHAGCEFEIGVSYDSDGEYPEYPPHWIHVSPPIDDGLGGPVECYADPNGQIWVTLSRPPGELWDRLPTKHMMLYINEHLRRFWNGA